MTLFLDAGGPLILVFYGGAVVAGVLATAGIVFGGLWLVRRARQNGQTADAGTADPPDPAETNP